MNGVLIPIVGCGIVGFAIVMLLTPIVLSGKWRSRFHRANDWHHTNAAPVPRLGGLVLVIAFLATEVLVALCWPQLLKDTPGHTIALLAPLAIFVLGFWDDLKPLGARRKLVGQVLVASAVYFCGDGIETLRIPFSEAVISLKGWGLVLTVIWLVGFTNLINLIDGVDGLAGGIAFMLMGLLVHVGWGYGAFVGLAAGMTGALLGFLRFNFPPARIYLGDGGAYFLGFQIGLSSIIGSHKGSIFGALVAPLFVLALPIVDTSLAILRRGLRGLPVFRPDRRHIHHRLIGMGMSRRKVVLWLYAVTLAFLLMGLAAFWSQGELTPVMLGVAALILLLCAGKLSFSRSWFAVHRILGNSLAMRHEVQYALCLTQLLAHEADRCGSVSDLYAELLSAARRLGFTSVRLTLADGQRTWEQNDLCVQVQSVRHEMGHGIYGVLELQAPSCHFAGDLPSSSELGGELAPTRPAPGIVDSKVFEIISELLAEAWVKAAVKWAPGTTALRFDSEPPQVEGINRRFKRPTAASTRGEETAVGSLASFQDAAG